jgi:putative transposase
MKMVHRRTCVYQIGYHIVFCTKYRAKVLTEAVEDALKGIITEASEDHGFEVAEIEVDKDHVHLFVCAPPHISIAILVKWIKGISARKLFVRFPDLKKKLYRGHLWNPSYYVGTVGEMSEDSVRSYIENQKAKNSEESA